MDPRLSAYLREVEAQLDALRERLRERYGWTRLELESSLDIAGGRLLISGEVAVAPLRALVRKTLEPLLFEGLELELELELLDAHSWYEIPRAGLQLWAEHPSKRDRSLATELTPDDGPVAALAHDGPGMLLRARDGTTGWATGLLGPETAPRPLDAPRLDLDPVQVGAQICSVARAYLGVPYRLGGASSTHIDCSALVQRAYLGAIGALLPRNSHDQLAAAGGGQLRGSTAGELGDLLFIHSRRMGRLHVGIIAEQGSILHASRSRDAVLEQPIVEFQLDAAWIRHVEWKHLCAWAHTQTGRSCVELPTRARHSEQTKSG